MAQQPYSEEKIGNLTRSQLEEIITEIAKKTIEREMKNIPQEKSQALAATFGTWEDERTETEIIAEIYDSRNSQSINYSNQFSCLSLCQAFFK